MNREDVLTVESLTLGYRTRTHLVRAVQDFSLSLRAGVVTGLAGESGSGKSTAALAMTGFRANNAEVSTGSVTFGGRDLLQATRPELRGIWGRHIAYIAQNAAASMNPALPVGRQFRDVLARHLAYNSRQARESALASLAAVGLTMPGVLDRYVHQFSGGQQQRVAIALALACHPAVLLLDEPTTGLDVTTQAQVTDLLRELVQGSDMAALYVSHDLLLLQDTSDEIVVMYAGEVVEYGPTAAVCRAPSHPYTRDLMQCIPNAARPTVLRGIRGTARSEVAVGCCGYAGRCSETQPECWERAPELVQVNATSSARCLRLAELRARGPVEVRIRDRSAPPEVQATLAVRGLTCEVGTRRKRLLAVADVDLTVGQGEVVALVGASGSGKSTILRAIIGLHPPTSGSILLDARPLPARAADRSRADRGALQLVFQNADLALNPRHTVRRTLSRPLRLFGGSRSAETMTELLAAVRLPSTVLDRYPHELSGGQRQRIAIARALAAGPRVLLCDEITSALDVSVQASIIELLIGLSQERSMSILFVSHDLGVVRSIAGRAFVMKDGQMCETGTLDDLFSSPGHEATRELLSALPGQSRTGILDGRC